MTVQRAIEMLQDFMEFKLKAAALLRDGASKSSVGDLARQQADLHDKERGMLEKILQELNMRVKTTRTKSTSTIKDIIADQVRIQVEKELKKSKRRVR